MKRTSRNTDTKIIGIAGAGKRAGCTHLALVMAHRLHSLGFNVALLEEDSKQDFRSIAEEYNCKINGDDCFSYQGIDYYMYRKPRRLPIILQKNYNYVIVDYGEYDNCDKDFFITTYPNIITCGTKPWEINQMDNIFSEIDETVLESLYYCFIFASQNKSLQKVIRKEMDTLKNVFFVPYNENPFKDCEFPELPQILGYQIEANEQKNIGFKKPVFNTPFSKQKGNAENDIQKANEETAIVVEEPQDTTTENSTEEIIPNTESLEEVSLDLEAEEFCVDNISGTEDNSEEKSPNFMSNSEKISDIIEDEDIPSSEPMENSENVEFAQKEAEKPIINESDIILIPEIKEAAEDLFLLTKEMQKALIRGKDKIGLADGEEGLLEQLINRQLQCSFASMLRASIIHTRENGKDGLPAIRIANEKVQYDLTEEYLKDILEKDAVYMIFPEKDNYVKI